MPEKTGTDANDNISGTLEDDVISGLAGDDRINASSGKDSVDGGSGIDTLAVSVNGPLFPAYEGNVRYVFGPARIYDDIGRLDTAFQSIERIVFTAFNAGFVEIDGSGWVPSSASPQNGLLINAGPANARVVGSAYNDQIQVSGTNNSVDGGAGSDLVIAIAKSVDAIITIATQNGVTSIVQDSADANSRTSVDVVNAEYVGVMASGHQVLTQRIDGSGSATNILFQNGAANDTFVGGRGDDVFAHGFYENNGNQVNTYTGGQGADYYDLTGTARDLNGTVITDFAVGDAIGLNGNTLAGHLITTFIGMAAFSGKAGEYRYEKQSGQTVVQYDGDGDGAADGTLLIQNGAFDLVQLGTAGQIHTLAIDAATLPSVPTSGDDTLTGTSGNDTINGLDGNDVLIGGFGADALNGGTGTDTASYADDGAAVFVNLSLGQGFGNSAQGDTYTSIENVIGSSANDFIIGDPGVNRLEGGAGDDTIIGGLGADVLIGGPGTDLLSFEDNSGTVFVNLLTGMGYNNSAQGDTFSGFENVVGGLFDDTLIGDNGANRLDGAMGADTLVGNGGADTFVFKHTPGSSSGFAHPNSNPNVDTLFDFVSGEDKLEISANAFGGGFMAGSLAAGAFVVGTAAGDADDRFVYDKANGRLYFDADGNGGGAQVLMALLPNHDAITASDFAIV